MTPTVFGIVVGLVGAFLLWRGTVLQMLLFVLGCSLMGGTAALVLTSLGGSSVSPAHLALVFLTLRVMLPGRGQMPALADAVAANRFLIGFVFYGLVGALLLPRVFAGAIDVMPLRPVVGGGIFQVAPLAFSNQNVTVSVYLIGTLLAGVAAHAAMRAEGAAAAVARAGAIIALTHAVLGLASVALAGTPLALLFDFFRNGFYAQLEQSFKGFIRMKGIWPEPAVYAIYGFTWLVFVTELWLRGVQPRLTGLAAFVLLLALTISTSSTAYVGIASYGVILLLRQLAVSNSVPPGKLVALFFVAGGSLAAVIAFAVAVPALTERLADVLALTTVDKLESRSGQERAFLARMGIDAFLASYGLGIGPGSFRSSGIVSAILGSMGIVGMAFFLAHLVRVFMPLRRSTWLGGGDERMAVGAAASWTAVVMLLPVSLTAASPDPGLLWGLMGGMALALRPSPAPAVRPFAPAATHGNEMVTLLSHGGPRPRRRPQPVGP
jgi:hypothetical protein